jgi:tetratricopeptide (TPR) repeat protein
MNPSDPTLEVRLGKALLTQGKTEEGLEAFRQVRQLAADLGISYECGQFLLEHEQFGLAREFLEAVVAADPTRSDARLDLAMATFHSLSAEAGLAELDKTSLEQRQGDYFLLRAQMLDTMGRGEEATDDLNRGFRANPTRADLYFQAALFLIKHSEYHEAIDILKRARRLDPDAPDVMLTEAITYELLNQSPQGQEILTQIESRWPEWGAPYLINGIMLESRMKSGEAKPLLETAIALGERDFRAYYYLALATMHIHPDDVASAQRANDQALQLNPNDPYVQALAGKLAYRGKDYIAAIEHLSAAIRLWPEMVEAHETLGATYRAMGEKDKSIAELKEVLRIKAMPAADQEPPSEALSLLFSVRTPSAAREAGTP